MSLERQLTVGIAVRWIETKTCVTEFTQSFLVRRNEAPYIEVNIPA